MMTKYLDHGEMQEVKAALSEARLQDLLAKIDNGAAMTIEDLDALHAALGRHITALLTQAASGLSPHLVAALAAAYSADDLISSIISDA